MIWKNKKILLIDLLIQKLIKQDQRKISELINCQLFVYFSIFWLHVLDFDQ